MQSQETLAGINHPNPTQRSGDDCRQEPPDDDHDMVVFALGKKQAETPKR